MSKKFYTYFDPPPVCTTKIEGDSMTHQECIEDTRIDNVIARCIVNPRRPLYGDFSHIPANISATEAFNLKKESEEALNELNNLGADFTGDSEGSSDSERNDEKGKGNKVNEDTSKS